jgi:DNA-binding response OmpR family regulator
MATRVMVINDTQEILELFQDILEHEGYEVILYSYAPNELQEIERHQPELIILDVIFGAEKTGWQLLQKLRMRQSTHTIPVILCTAAIQAVREMEGYLLAQGIKVVPKPFDLEALLVAVKEALQLPQRSAILREGRSSESSQDNT